MMPSQKIDFAEFVLAKNYKGIIGWRKGKKGLPVPGYTVFESAKVLRDFKVRSKMMLHVL
jgi:hypothetical protein